MHCINDCESVAVLWCLRSYRDIIIIIIIIIIINCCCCYNCCLCIGTFGCATYAAVRLNYAMKYAPRDDNDHRLVLICAALAGKPTVGTSIVVEPPYRKNVLLRYNSIILAVKVG